MRVLSSGGDVEVGGGGVEGGEGVEGVQGGGDVDAKRGVRPTFEVARRETVCGTAGLDVFLWVGVLRSQDRPSNSDNKPSSSHFETRGLVSARESGD